MLAKLKTLAKNMPNAKINTADFIYVYYTPIGCMRSTPVIHKIFQTFTFFNRNEFKTTLILLKAIATAAKTGLSKIPKSG